MNSNIWNPWHGCTKYSEGCKNCYVYRRDESVGRDASEVFKTASFDLPVQKNADGSYKLKEKRVYCCMTSDFFLDKADEWRADCWRYIKERSDIEFVIITKRITRFEQCVPPDWGTGYENVCITCTVENQRRCDERLPAFLKANIAHKMIASEPLLEKIDMSRYLDSSIELIVAGGESGNNARICDYEWILSLHSQANDAGVPFYFKQTGARFIKDGKIYRVPRRDQHSQARRAGINTISHL